MSKDLNQCNFIGRLGKDVDLRFTPSGSAVANFSIACGDDYKDKQSGQKVEKTNWINVVAFGKLGEICGDYLQKGSQVFVSGKFTTEKYEKDGQTRYSTKIIANDVQFLGGKQDNQASQAEGQQNNSQPHHNQTDDSIDDGVPF